MCPHRIEMFFESCLVVPPRDMLSGTRCCTLDKSHQEIWVWILICRMREPCSYMSIARAACGFVEIGKIVKIGKIAEIGKIGKTFPAKLSPRLLVNANTGPAYRSH
jgi:hypothetical protein